MVKLPCPTCKGTGRVMDPVSLGADLRKQRQKTDLSLSEVARRMQITKAYLSDMERGRRVFTARQRHKFLAVLKGDRYITPKILN